MVHMKANCNTVSTVFLHTSPKRNVVAGWQQTTLILLIASFTIGGLTLLVSFCGFCVKWLTLAWVFGAIFACK